MREQEEDLLSQEIEALKQQPQEVQKPKSDNPNKEEKPKPNLPKNSKPEDNSGCSCLMGIITLVIIAAISFGAYCLFFWDEEEQNISYEEKAEPNTNSKAFLDNIIGFISQRIESEDHYVVKNLQLQESKTQNVYKGTITYERLGREFTNAISVTHKPDKGSVKWDIYETQEEVDYVNRTQAR